MKIILDGMTVEIHERSTLLELLEERGEPLGHVLVELNGRLVAREALQVTFLEEGDSVEVILPAIGG